jgi:large subunit ribosomal protein L31
VKKDTHPIYRPVVFQDTGANQMYLTRSAVATNATVEYEGKEYPLVKVDISSASHPFFTGKQTFIDTAGRVDRFQKKFGERGKFGGGKPKKPSLSALKKK